MGIFDIFKKNKKYDVKPENNEPRFVYGVPDPSKFNIKPEKNVPEKVYGIPSPSKYDIKPEENVPEDLYGVKRPKEDMEIKKCPKCGKNLKEYIYGKITGEIDTSKYALGGCIIKPDNPKYRCPDCKYDYDENLNLITETLDKVLKEEIGVDPFWSDTIKKYFNDNVNPKDEGVFITLIRELAKDKEIFNEFTKFLVNKNYNIENAISVDGVTAKDLAEKNLDKNGVEIYLELYKIKNKEDNK